MLLGESNIELNLPPFGTITLFDASDLFGSGTLIFMGGFVSIIVMYIMIAQRRAGK